MTSSSVPTPTASTSSARLMVSEIQLVDGVTRTLTHPIVKL
jgi:hypothetical protein